MFLNFRLNIPNRECHSSSFDIAPDETVSFLLSLLRAEFSIDKFRLINTQTNTEINIDNPSVALESLFQDLGPVIEIRPRKSSRSTLSSELTRFFASQNAGESLSAVENNLYHTIEHFPESFGSVVLLFISLTLNNRKLVALVDTGAQASIICSSIVSDDPYLSSIVDKRFTGMAKGVGLGNILGRIHSVEITLWQSVPFKSAVVLPCGFHVLDMQRTGKIDLIIGLDMLRRHQIVIDLKENLLIAHGCKINFMAEWELPDSLKGNQH